MQKIMIVSDTHRRHEGLKAALAIESPIDMMIHLGDAEGEEDYIAALADCPLEIIAGNNDYFSELQREKVIEIAGKKVLLTHGHYYYVSVGLDMIKTEAIARDMDIVMFGHMHRPIVEIDKDITVINPGSLTYPRQDGCKKSYIIMNIDNDGKIEYTIKYVD